MSDKYSIPLALNLPSDTYKEYSAATGYGGSALEVLAQLRKDGRAPISGTAVMRQRLAFCEPKHRGLRSLDEYQDDVRDSWLDGEFDLREGFIYNPHTRSVKLVRDASRVASFSTNAPYASFDLQTYKKINGLELQADALRFGVPMTAQKACKNPAWRWLVNDDVHLLGQYHDCVLSLNVPDLSALSLAPQEDLAKRLSGIVFGGLLRLHSLYDTHALGTSVGPSERGESRLVGV